MLYSLTRTPHGGACIHLPMDMTRIKRLARDQDHLSQPVARITRICGGRGPEHGHLISAWADARTTSRRLAADTAQRPDGPRPPGSGRAAGYCAGAGPGARGRAHVYGRGPAASGGEHAPGGLLFGCGGHFCADGHRVHSRAAGTAVVQPGAGGRRGDARARDVRARGGRAPRPGPARAARRTAARHRDAWPRGSSRRPARPQPDQGDAVGYPGARQRGGRDG